MSDPLPDPGREPFDLTAWQAVIGPRNQAYYLSRFERATRGEGGGHWHWPAFLITWYWLVYRKMWAWALLYRVLPILLLLPFGLLAALLGPHRAADAIPMLYLATLYIAPPLLANGTYYRQKPLRSIAPRVVIGSAPARWTRPSATLPQVTLAQPAGLQQALTRRGIRQQR